MDISQYQHMNIRMSTRGKRPLRNLTPSDKVRAIQRIHNGETKASVSRDIGVPESTLRGWCKNEQKLRFMCRQMGVDHTGSARVENLPSEKRAKFDGPLTSSTYPSVPNYENMGYNRLPLNPMDFGGNNSALLSKFCMNNFEKKNLLTNIKHTNSSSATSMPGSRAVTTADCSQISLMQNPNLLALLNSNLLAMSSMGAENILSDKKPTPSAEYFGSSNDIKNEAPALSVKNWAKDFSENFDTKEHEVRRNDTNNNDLKSNMLSSGLTTRDAGVFPLLFPTGLPPIPNTFLDQDKSNAALLEWCKMFNASINFLALAAAAASLHQQPTALSGISVENDSNTSASSGENLLFKQLTQVKESSMKTHAFNDLSNDCAYESEPEDLSVRSTTSKLSSPANSRSHSPAKSNASQSSSNSDNEQ